MAPRGKPVIKGGTRHKLPRTRRIGKGPGHPPALRKTSPLKGTKRPSK